MTVKQGEAELRVLVAEVLAEAAGVDPSRSFDTEAARVALAFRSVRPDWAGRPTITWAAAAELLESLKAEAARKRAEIEEQAIEQDRVFRASLPPGVPAERVPVGMTAGQLMMAADPERHRARRRSVVEDALAHAGTVYTPLQPEPADQ